jgi:hypothetical protein
MEIADLGDFSICKHVEVQGSIVGAVRCVGWAQKELQLQDVSSFRLGLENLIVCFDQCLNKFGNCMELQECCPKTSLLFLSPLISIHGKK